MAEIGTDGKNIAGGAGFTINNNYSNNTISIIDGTAINAQSQGQGNQLVGQGLVNPSELKELSSASFVSPPQLASMSHSDTTA